MMKQSNYMSLISTCCIPPALWLQQDRRSIIKLNRVDKCMTQGKYEQTSDEIVELMSFISCSMNLSSNICCVCHLSYVEVSKRGLSVGYVKLHVLLVRWAEISITLFYAVAFFFCHRPIVVDNYISVVLILEDKVTFIFLGKHVKLYLRCHQLTQLSGCHMLPAKLTISKMNEI